MFTSIKGFYRKENGKLAISHDDVDAFYNFVKFYLGSEIIDNKKDFNFAIECLIGAFENAMREVSFKLDENFSPDNPFDGLWLEVKGKDVYFDKN